MEALEHLGEMWGLNSLNKVQKKIAGVDASGELNFETIKILRDLFFVGLNTANEVFPFTSYELMDYAMFENHDLLGKLMSAYAKTLQKAPPVDPNVRKGQKKK